MAAHHPTEFVPQLPFSHFFNTSQAQEQSEATAEWRKCLRGKTKDLSESGGFRRKIPIHKGVALIQNSLTLLDKWSSRGTSIFHSLHEMPICPPFVCHHHPQLHCERWAQCERRMEHYQAKVRTIFLCILRGFMKCGCLSTTRIALTNPISD